MERYAHTLVDRIFPEYADVFSNPFLPSGERLIRELGLAPRALAEREPQVRELLRTASRNRLAPETIEHLLQAAQSSIGVRQTEERPATATDLHPRLPAHASPADRTD